MLELGSTAKDLITSVQGVVIGKCSYLTGCDQYLIQPIDKEKKKKPEGLWFDSNRLVKVGKKQIHIDTSVDNGPDLQAPTK